VVAEEIERAPVVVVPARTADHIDRARPRQPGAEVEVNRGNLELADAFGRKVLGVPPAIGLNIGPASTVTRVLEGDAPSTETSNCRVKKPAIGAAVRPGSRTESCKSSRPFRGRFSISKRETTPAMPCLS
jgi:hypothetical protein